MPQEFTSETAKPVEAADKALKNATTSGAVSEALTGLATSTDPSERAAEVSRATNVLVNQGDLPELLVTFDGNENLGRLGMGDDQIDINNQTEMDALRSAAETGTFVDADGNTVTLSTEEWIAANALYQNFQAIEGTAGEDAGDGIVSVADIVNATTDPAARERLGIQYAETETAVMTFPGNPDGSANPASFTAIFGKEDVSRREIADLITSPQFDELTPQQQRGVLALYSQYDNIAGKDGDASSVNVNDLWTAAGELGINYGANHEAMAETQADVDSFEEATGPQDPVSGDAVDSILRDLAKPMESGESAFDLLDGADGTVDGNLDQATLHALVSDTTAMELIDPRLAASLRSLDANWAQLSGGDGTISLTELAGQSSSYQGDTTIEAIEARATAAGLPPTEEEIDAAMRAIYQPNPGTDTSVFYTLTQGQEGNPEDRPGFTREDIDRTLDTYKALYGEDSPEYQNAQASLGKVRTDFDKYDLDGDGAISYDEMAEVSGNAATVGDLQGIYSDTAGGATPSLQPGSSVPMGAGEGIVNEDGTVTYTIQPDSASDRETPERLADSVLNMWGGDGSYTDEERAAVLALINELNPGAYDPVNGWLIAGVVLNIPAESPSEET